MPFNVRHVTNSLLQRGFREARGDMSPMKIQKLLFYLNGWHLAVHGQPAIDTPFEPWDYGPVVPTVYRELRDYGRGNVTSYIKDMDWKGTGAKAYVISDDCKDFQEILDLTWEKYIGFNALQLSAMTHQPGSPWDLARKAGLNAIPDDVTRDYFVGLAQTA
jgi:uncharacterized phage-associated protein